ncbi:probable chitinase 10 [Belonocnema kinseyi]|uniref:probable chitinase 10 n=1 Tax=Belonocnema kinseyi TaxID=2817044 RepID=UPI00143D490B|nr:probable chitinase 10 [Belonocnema kinseyi]
MRRLIILLEICSAFALGREVTVPADECGKTLGCYFGGGSIDDIDTFLCTHMFYGYAGFGEDISIRILEPFDYAQGKAYIDVKGLQQKNKELKILVPVGDKYDNFRNISNNDIPYSVLTDPDVREKLVNNIVNFVKESGFNGIDLDLTNPPQNGGRPSDKENIVLLLKALREEFDKEGLILSALADPSEKTVKLLYDIEGISKYVSFINLKTFDFHGMLDADKKLGHSSPLYHSSEENEEDRKKNVDSIVKQWISEGAPSVKLIIGIAFYGRSYTLASSEKIGRGAKFAHEGKCGSSPEYYNLCPLLKNKDWKRIYDKEQKVPYMYNGTEVVTYDDEESIKTKAEYVMNTNLGGAMAWTANQDDFHGKCGEKFPLLKTLKSVLRNKC